MVELSQFWSMPQKKSVLVDKSKPCPLIPGNSEEFYPCPLMELAVGIQVICSGIPDRFTAPSLRNDKWTKVLHGLDPDPCTLLERQVWCFRYFRIQDDLNMAHFSPFLFFFPLPCISIFFCIYLGSNNPVKNKVRCQWQEKPHHGEAVTPWNPSSCDTIWLLPPPSWDMVHSLESWTISAQDRQENKLSQLHPFPGGKGWRVMRLFPPESVLFTNTFLCCSISIPYKQLLEMQIYFSKCNCVLQTTGVLLTMTNVSWQGSQGQQLWEVEVFVAFPLDRKCRGWKIMHKVFLTLPKTLICHCYLQ